MKKFGVIEVVWNTAFYKMVENGLDFFHTKIYHRYVRKRLQLLIYEVDFFSLLIFNIQYSYGRRRLSEK